MDSRRIDQLLPAAHVGDATGDASLHLADALERAGHQAGLYSLTVDPPLRGRVLPFDAFPAPRPGDVTVLHYALPSSLNHALTTLASSKAIVYHNLTPPEMLLPHCPEVARLTAMGRDQLMALAASRSVDLAIGVSEYNTADLMATGFEATATLPLPMDLARYDQPPDPVLAAHLSTAPRIFLTVGRLAPNKRLEAFLRAAAYYLRYIDASAWFVMVGGHRGLEGYYDALAALHDRLGLDERVRFAGRVSHSELLAWYAAASVYVCTSEHEGFCAPLLEAMHFELPILARHAAAVPETLGGAGLTFTNDDPATLAETLHLLATDGELRERLVARGKARLPAYAPEQVTARWVATLARLGT